MDHKDIQHGNEGKPLVPGETENLSSSRKEDGSAHLPDARLGAEDEPAGNPDIVEKGR